MLIDPFTVVAQIINFVILAVALKYFLYDRVMAAMDTREAEIARRLDEADGRESAATAEIDAYRARSAQFDHDRVALLDEAQADVAKQREVLLDRTRHDVDEARQQWHRGLQAEQRDFERELRRRTSHEVIALSRQALSDLAGTGLEHAVIEMGLHHLADTSDAREALCEAIADGGVMAVHTSFVLGPEQQRAMGDRINALMGGIDAPIRFEPDPNLVLGIEFRGGGTAVCWHAADYLDRLDATVTGLSATLDRLAHGD